jgi:hypothetical protein
MFSMIADDSCFSYGGHRWIEAIDSVRRAGTRSDERNDHRPRMHLHDT